MEGSLNSSESLGELLEDFKRLLSINMESFMQNPFPVIPPRLNRHLTVEILEKALSIIKAESIIIDIHGDFIVVGDIHGHLMDLIRVFQQYGLPPQRKYVFLGDLVDRGPYSTEVIIWVLSLKVAYPECVYFVRGNHEFEQVCSSGGFKEECLSVYDDDTVFKAFIDVFDYMAFVVRINNQYLCLHGGIGARFTKLSDLTKISRPLHDLYGGIADEIVWSDPSEEIQFFRESDRGTGYTYGDKALTKFLDENGLKVLIRGHQSVMQGCVRNFNDRCITIHTASSTMGIMDNASGLLIISSNGDFQCVTFPPLPFQKRPNNLYIRRKRILEDRSSPALRLVNPRSHSIGIKSILSSRIVNSNGTTRSNFGQ